MTTDSLIEQIREDIKAGNWTGESEALDALAARVRELEAEQRHDKQTRTHQQQRRKDEQ